MRCRTTGQPGARYGVEQFAQCFVGLEQQTARFIEGVRPQKRQPLAGRTHRGQRSRRRESAVTPDGHDREVVLPMERLGTGEEPVVFEKG